MKKFPDKLLGLKIYQKKPARFFDIHNLDAFKEHLCRWNSLKSIYYSNKNDERENFFIDFLINTFLDSDGEFLDKVS